MTPPQVSVVIPCYNEQNTIGLLLDALYAQTFPREAMEVVIADGMSTDRTREVIAAWQQKHADLTVRVIDNPQRIIPAAINRAVAAAQGEIIVRLDAHSVPAPDYIARSVAALETGKGDNVGGVWEIRPRGTTWIARSIAVAAAHPLGVGDAHYRHATTAAAVDTVPFGAFYRQLFEHLGGFDETLLTNEDYEFNTRIRENGGKVWLDPAIRSVYFARPNLRALARQYWRYGYWKAQMLRRYPHTLRWRQALPPLFVLSLLTLIVLSPLKPVFRWLLAFQISVYALALLAAALHVAWKQRDFTLLAGFPLAVAVMHLTWGGGLLWGLLRPPRQPKSSL